MITGVIFFVPPQEADGFRKVLHKRIGIIWTKRQAQRMDGCMPSAAHQDGDRRMIIFRQMDVSRTGTASIVEGM